MRHSARTFASLLLLAPLASIAGAVAQQPDLAWQLQDSGVEVPLRGLSAVSERVAWASGANGTWLRTIDGGTTWQHGQIPGAEELGVRDIHAFDELSAVALTIASPGRVYRTLDGGYTWTMVFEDRRPEVFFNCMDFADDQRGYAVGDPINGRFLLIETLDGGKNWAPLSAPSRPEPQEAEAQFAASGTCLQANGDNVWIGTGGSVARDRAALTSRGVRGSSGDPSQDLASTSSASPPTAPSGLRELQVALPGYSGANRRGVCVCEFSQHGRHGPIRL